MVERKGPKVKHNPRFLKQLAALCAVMALTACGTTRTMTIKVPVPVECQEAVPERPVMPTEQFTTAPSLDQFTQAAQAEIERREGYEKRLNAALAACIAPMVI
jgi:hypothetical protein